MKSEIENGESEKSPSPYPCLMQFKDEFVILATGLGRGTLLTACKEYEVGHYSENWNLNSQNFHVFTGRIILSN